jgi:hypothetical protein
MWGAKRVAHKYLERFWVYILSGFVVCSNSCDRGGTALLAVFDCVVEFPTGRYSDLSQISILCWLIDKDGRSFGDHAGRLKSVCFRGKRLMGRDVQHLSPVAWFDFLTF